MSLRWTCDSTQLASEVTQHQNWGGADKVHNGGKNTLTKGKSAPLCPSLFSGWSSSDCPSAHVQRCPWRFFFTFLVSVAIAVTYYTCKLVILDSRKSREKALEGRASQRWSLLFLYITFQKGFTHRGKMNTNDIMAQSHMGNRGGKGGDRPSAEVKFEVPHLNFKIGLFLHGWKV